MTHQKCEYCTFDKKVPESLEAPYGGPAKIFEDGFCGKPVIERDEIQALLFKDGLGQVHILDNYDSGYAYQEVDLPANYCPVCGRKLND